MVNYNCYIFSNPTPPICVVSVFKFSFFKSLHLLIRTYQGPVLLNCPLALCRVFWNERHATGSLRGVLGFNLLTLIGTRVPDSVWVRFCAPCLLHFNAGVLPHLYKFN